MKCGRSTCPLQISHTDGRILEAKTPHPLATFDEVLRLKTSFGLTDREALTDTVVLGQPVPKRTVIFMSLLGPGLRKPALPLQENLRSDSSQAKIWDKDEVTYDSQAGHLLSFGLRPRQCLGKRLGCLQLRILTTLPAWNFEFEGLEAPLCTLKSVELNVRKLEYCYVKLQKAKIMHPLATGTAARLYSTPI